MEKVILNSFTNPVLAFETNGTLCFANTSANELLAKHSQTPSPTSFDSIFAGNPSVTFSRVREEIKATEINVVKWLILPHATEEVKKVVASFAVINDEANKELIICTLKKQADALASSTQRIFEAAPDAMLLVNKQGEIAMANRQAEQLFGYHKTELLEQPIKIIFPNKFVGYNKELIENLFTKLAKRKNRVNVSLYSKKKGGTAFPTSIATSTLNIEGQAFIAMSFRDLTAKYKTLTEIKTSKELLKAVSETKTETIMVLDSEFKIKFSNQRAKHLGELITKSGANHNIIGTSVLDLVDEEAQIRLKSMYTLALGGETVSYERANEAGVIIQNTIYPLRNDRNEIIGVAHSFVDVSERKKLAVLNKELTNRLTLIAENFPNGSVTLLNRDQTILYTNGAGFKEFGIDPSLFIDTPIKSMLQEPIYNRFNYILPQVLAGDTVEYQVKFENKKYLNVVKPIFNEYEQVENLILTSVDITDIANYQRKIMIQNRALNHLAWRQSHDFRRPVANILGLIELISLSNDEQEAKGYIHLIEQSALELDSIIHTIVDEANHYVETYGEVNG